jgi:hypothetical protein
MGKILDYLQWRGDLSFSKNPFNDIDALILSLLSYLPLKDIVPGIDSNKEISLIDASIQYFSSVPTTATKSSTIKSTASSSFGSEIAVLLKRAANCPRFEKIRLSRFEENTDFVVGRQFAAVTFTLQNTEYKKWLLFEEQTAQL